MAPKWQRITTLQSAVHSRTSSLVTIQDISEEQQIFPGGTTGHAFFYVHVYLFIFLCASVCKHDYVYKSEGFRLKKLCASDFFSAGFLCRLQLNLYIVINGGWVAGGWNSVRLLLIKRDAVCTFTQEA